MKLYHGSNVEIESIDLVRGRRGKTLEKDSMLILIICRLWNSAPPLSEGKVLVSRP